MSEHVVVVVSADDDGLVVMFLETSGPVVQQRLSDD